MTESTVKKLNECEACRILTTGGLAGVGLYLFSIRKEARNPRLVTFLGTACLVLSPLNYYYHRFYKAPTETKITTEPPMINK